MIDDEEESAAAPPSGANAAPIIDDAPAPAAAPVPGGTTLDDATLAEALIPSPPAAGESAAPGLEALPDLSPTTVPPTPDVAPPPGARQKFSRTVASPEDKAIAGDQSKLTEAAVTAERNKSAVEQAKIRDEQTFRAEQTAQAIEHQKRLDELIKKHDERLDQELQRQQNYFDAARQQSYEKVMGPGLGDRILGALAISLGGLGGGTNQALQIYDDRMKRDYAERQAKIEGAWKIYEAQGKNVAAAREGRDRALEDEQLLQAARHDAAADQLASMKIAQGVPAEQAQADANVVAIRQKALDIRRDVAKQTQDKVEWDTYGKARGAGGAGGAGAGDAMGKFIEAAGALKAGDPIPPEFGKLAAAAHIKPNQIASEVDKYRGSGDKASKNAAAAAAGGSKQLRGDFQLWDRESNFGKVALAHDKLSALKTKLSDPNVDPLSLKSALMELDTAARGGTATGASMQAIQGSLGGWIDQIAGKISHGESGKLAPAQVDIMRKAVDASINANKEEGNSLHQSFMSKFYGSPTYQREHDAVAAQSESLFGRWGYKSDRTKARDAEAGGAKAPAATPAIPADHGEAADKLERAKSAANNPNLSPSQRSKAKAYIDAYTSHVGSLGAR